MLGGELILNQLLVVVAAELKLVAAGSARLRLTLSTAHSAADVDDLLAALARVWHEEPSP